jgi:retron-type reverse transcriptase
MHEREKSDTAVVAVKPTNKAGASIADAAEWVEPRAGTKRNAGEQSTHRTLSRVRVTQALDRVRQAAKQRKKEKFTALFHHLSIDLFREAFLALKRDAAPGVDDLTWRIYAADFECNLIDLHARVHRGAYRALPSRRTYIPKADGRQRPLAVAALEDKIVQRATVAVLNSIYEEEFLGFSYGFRPKRGQHDALDALVVGITRKRVNFILDADVRSFFDEVSQGWLVRFVVKRKSRRDRMRTRLKEIKEELRLRRHQPIPEQGKWLAQVVRGYFAYHAVPTNSASIRAFRHYVVDLWRRSLSRRSQKGRVTWQRIKQIADDLLPRARILHPWPQQRFAVRYSR